jgi:hypothetical protein
MILIDNQFGFQDGHPVIAPSQEHLREFINKNSQDNCINIKHQLNNKIPLFREIVHTVFC